MKNKEHVERFQLWLDLVRDLNKEKWFTDLWHIMFFGDGSGSIRGHVYFTMFKGQALHDFHIFLKKRGFSYFIMQNSENPNLIEIHIQEAPVPIALQETESESQ